MFLTKPRQNIISQWSILLFLIDDGSGDRVTISLDRDFRNSKNVKPKSSQVVSNVLVFKKTNLLSIGRLT